MIAWRRISLAALAFAASLCAAPPLVFPEPLSLKTLPADMALGTHPLIAIPAKPSDGELRTARVLSAELADKFRVGAEIGKLDALPSGQPVIVVGTFSNPLVKRWLAQEHVAVSAADPGPEGYFLRVQPNLAVVAGSDERGAFYGMQSLRQLLAGDRTAARLRGVEIRDRPYKPFRGVKLFLPGRDHIPFFKRFVRDFMALHKFNRMILEMNAGMRFDRHPELNAGALDFADTLNYSRRDRSHGPKGEGQDSSHHDTADGAVLEKEEVAELVRWAADNYIEVIPEIPSLTHSYYLLTRHRELAEIQDAEWPDTYCPLLPASQKLLFDVMDEYIKVMKPKMIHVGHDEWRIPMHVCPRCKDKDYGQLFIDDLLRTYEHLKQKNIRTAIWGDHLIEPLRGVKSHKSSRRDGTSYEIPGAITPEQTAKFIPKDILIFNWFWGGPENEGEDLDDSFRRVRPNDTRKGESNDLLVVNWGFQQVYGNFKPGMANYERRSQQKGVIGGAPSAWQATTEFSFGKDLMYEFLGSAEMLWSHTWRSQAELSLLVQDMMPAERRNLHGKALPSELGDPVVKVAIQAGKPVAIGEDVSSILFLHALEKPSKREKITRYVFNAPDTNSLVGWYDVEYEDGYVITVPVRYGVNILDWAWKSKPVARYCYDAVAVPAGDRDGQPATFFSYEWENPRLGQTIREVRLHNTSGGKDLRRRPVPQNSILLKGVSIVRKREPNGPIRATQ